MKRGGNKFTHGTQEFHSFFGPTCDVWCAARDPPAEAQVVRAQVPGASAAAGRSGAPRSAADRPRTRTWRRRDGMTGRLGQLSSARTSPEERKSTGKTRHSGCYLRRGMARRQIVKPVDINTEDTTTCDCCCPSERPLSGRGTGTRVARSAWLVEGWLALRRTASRSLAPREGPNQRTTSQPATDPTKVK
jgi:hypothetical protein